jgi:Fic family protein
MLENIEKAVVLKNELDDFRPLKKEDEQRIMQKFRLDWNYHSNHLEGNSLTYGETKALILFGITAQGKPLKDHFEITGHNEALKWVLDIVGQDRPLTENFIRELHQLLLKESYEVDAVTPEGLATKKRIHPGVYKSTPNHVITNTGEVFYFSTPEETPAKMHDLMDWYRQKMNDSELNPILLAAEFHYKFIRIHPFDDGNGRTARILMNFILMQFGYPPAIIRTEDKLNYFAALRQADAGLLEPFIDYVAQNLVRSLEIMIKGAKGESIEEPDDLDKEIALLDQRLKGISQGKTRMEVLLDLFDNSISKLIVKFVEKGNQFNQYYSSFDQQVVSKKFRERDSGNHQIIRELFDLKEIVNDKSVLYKLRDFITDDLIDIEVNLVYRKFNQSGFDVFDFDSQIIIQFDDLTYSVSGSSENVTFEKRYHEKLTNADIDELVKAEIRMHKDRIEKEIEGTEHKLKDL